ncbi:MAG: NAD(P)-binding protein, partial [Burkholderiales bacterium]|nr:NAD(P)-binding protein [Burkholderiales bacterium]
MIVGAGALGSIYAAYLSRGGHQVSLIARGARAAGIAKCGIEVTGQDAFVAQCDIVTKPETL